MRVSSEMPVQGVVAAGFEGVRSAFAENVAEVGVGGAAFAAVVDGQMVVDLWAGSSGAGPWRRETRSILMSTTKGIVAAAVARLIDRGELDVEAPVARYWPEFAQGGKGAVTVAQLLSHSAGLITVPGYEEFMSPDGEGWDHTEEIVRRLAAAVPEWEPGSEPGYHGLTIGWLVDELVRRITGQSVGTLIRQELAEPLALELDLGTPVERHGLVAELILTDGRAVVADEEPGGDPDMLARMLLAVDGRSILDTAPAFFLDPARLQLELGGSNATGTARAVAKLYGALANDGRYVGVRVLTQETIRLCAERRIGGFDRVLGVQTGWGLGFARRVSGATADETIGLTWWGPHDEVFGANGYGGQFGFADPVGRVGVGFIRSELTATSPLGADMVRALYDCLDRSGR